MPTILRSLPGRATCTEPIIDVIALQLQYVSERFLVYVVISEQWLFFVCISVAV